MIHFVSSLIGAVAAIGLIFSGLIFMVSPKQGGEMLKRLAIFIVGALIGICLLQQFVACIQFRPVLLLLGVAMSVAAFVIRESRQPRTPQHGSQHRGAERTPVMPTHIDDEEDL
jgi:Ca2+/Na+ antiporter